MLSNTGKYSVRSRETNRCASGGWQTWTETTGTTAFTTTESTILLGCRLVRVLMRQRYTNTPCRLRIKLCFYVCVILRCSYFKVLVRFVINCSEMFVGYFLKCINYHYFYQHSLFLTSIKNQVLHFNLVFCSKSPIFSFKLKVVVLNHLNGF